MHWPRPKEEKKEILRSSRILLHRYFHAAPSERAHDAFFCPRLITTDTTQLMCTRCKNTIYPKRSARKIRAVATSINASVIQSYRLNTPANIPASLMRVHNESIKRKESQKNILFVFQLRHSIACQYLHVARISDRSEELAFADLLAHSSRKVLLVKHRKIPSGSNQRGYYFHTPRCYTIAWKKVASIESAP